MAEVLVRLSRSQSLLYYTLATNHSVIPDSLGHHENIRDPKVRFSESFCGFGTIQWFLGHHNRV